MLDEQFDTNNSEDELTVLIENSDDIHIEPTVNFPRNFKNFVDQLQRKVC